MQDSRSIARRLTLALIVSVATMNSSCGETAAETLTRLEAMIAGEAAGAQSTAEALAEINELLLEKNRELSEPLGESAVPRILKRSLNGGVVAWSERERFFFRTPEGLGSLEPGNNEIRDFNLSYSGRYAVVLLETATGCQPTVVSIEDKRMLAAPGNRKLPEASCYELPAVTDDGSTYIHAAKGGLNLLPLQTNSDGSVPADGRLAAKYFPAKYKKITNSFSLMQMNERGLLIFHGGAGAYRMYHYAGTGATVTGVTVPGKAMVARPILYSVFEGDTLTISDESLAEAAAGEANSARPPNKTYALDTAQAFVYAGGAGRRRLHGVRFDSPPRVFPGLPARVSQQLAFVRDRAEFLTLFRDHMSYWDPVRNRKAPLPLVARDFVLYSGGLVYVDLLDRLYLRREPFSRFEMELMRLRDAAEKKVSPES